MGLLTTRTMEAVKAILRALTSSKLLHLDDSAGNRPEHQPSKRWTLDNVRIHLERSVPPRQKCCTQKLTSTGKLRPGMYNTGASFQKLRILSISIVADIKITLSIV